MPSPVVRGSLLATLLLLYACALSESSPEDDERLATFEHQVEDYREQLRIPGMSAVIVKDQKVLWAKGFGYADHEKRIPATPDTLYSIASVVDYSGVRLIWHGGNWGTGFSAIYVKVPERNLSLIMLANSEALNDHLYAIWNGSEEIMNDVFACAFVRRFVFEGAPRLDCESRSQAALAKWREKRRERARVVVDVDPKILQAYVGEYQFEKYPTMILHVTMGGDKLFVDVPRDHTSQAFARSPTTFFFKFRPAEMTFVKEGSAAHLEWAEFGEVLRANKKR